MTEVRWFAVSVERANFSCDQYVCVLRDPAGQPPHEPERPCVLWAGEQRCGVIHRREGAAKKHAAALNRVNVGGAVARWSTTPAGTMRRS